MNLYQLRYFVTLAHLEHYTRAAEQLCIAQPSLSNAIGLLEAEMGVRLFEKDGRNVILTKFGKLFLVDVEKALGILDSSIKTLQLAGQGESVIELGFLRTLGTHLVPEAAAGFLKENEGRAINFHFSSGITSVLLQGLKERRLDLVFCSKDERETGIDFVPVSSQDLVLIVPPSHPLSDRDSVRLVETLPYPQVFFALQSGLRMVIDDLFRKIEGQPIIAYEIEEDQVIAGLVAQNFGIAVVPKMDILSQLDVKILEISEPAWERNFYMATLKNRYLPPAVLAFREFVLKNVPL